VQGDEAMRADRSPQEVGALLRAACLGAPMTPEELAEKPGVNIRTISALERRRTSRPHPRTVRLLADTLGLAETTSPRCICRLGSDILAALDAQLGVVWAVGCKRNMLFERHRRAATAPFAEPMNYADRRRLTVQSQPPVSAGGRSHERAPVRRSRVDPES